ncbi:MAG: hypothetical protein U5K71_08015 [Gracilimonas sp.]|nr:hypothetical protein [Gracilimonas sp.]
MKASILLVFVIIFSMAACVSSSNFETESPNNGEIILDKEIVSQINSSSSSVSVNGAEYMIGSFAWKDFMPIVDPPVRLTIKNTLIRTDGNNIQSNIEIIQHYIVRENEIWRPNEMEVRQDQSSSNQLDIISREGPTWEIGSKVNIGLKIKDHRTGNIHWLSITEVEVVRTD